MNAARPVIEWLADARQYALKAQDIAYDATHGEFGASSLAIRYCLVAIGEALDWVPEEILADEPQIPWRKIIALRHRLVHGFWLIDEDIVGEIVRNEMGALIAALEHLIQRLE